MSTPKDLINGDVDSYVWCDGYWEDARMGSVVDAQKRTRGQAASYFANEIGDLMTSVVVWKRYILPWTRQEAWDHEGRDRAVDDYSFDHDCDWDKADREVPETVPDGWEPSDDSPVWEFIHRDHPRAIPVWICAEKGSKRPHDPKPREKTS